MIVTLDSIARQEVYDHAGFEAMLLCAAVEPLKSCRLIPGMAKDWHARNVTYGTTDTQQESSGPFYLQLHCVSKKGPRHYRL